MYLSDVYSGVYDRMFDLVVGDGMISPRYIFDRNVGSFIAAELGHAVSLDEARLLACILVYARWVAARFIRHSCSWYRDTYLRTNYWMTACAYSCAGCVGRKLTWWSCHDCPVGMCRDTNIYRRSGPLFMSHSSIACFYHDIVVAAKRAGLLAAITQLNPNVLR